MEFLSRLFSQDFMPHGHCYLWRPEILWLHVLSDAAIVLAYYLIPVALVRLVRGRSDLRFGWMFWMFGSFIFLCGTTHLLNIWTTWNGTYRIEGVMKALTGAVSLTTAIALWPLIPKAIALPNTGQLTEANRALQQANEGLEQRVAERTSELARSNQELQQFAYVASHDLREPLRTMCTFLQLLERRTRDQLDDEAREYLTFAIDGSRRMDRLVQGVLDYSRFVPLTIFAALLARAIPGPQGEWLPRALAIGCAGLAAHRTKQAWFGLIAGIVAYWLLRQW